ncbi:transporter [Roseibium aquae]|uniref:TRAP transporter small permease protein n=1 Tax=Roseibium aquae TaxID=1323746 RepID=A0A916TLS9_9HYPH|nr:TRAP transporter small permease subunit [Roseibium aquae]GGB55981.1 transporter [Roseibium aquae]
MRQLHQWLGRLEAVVAGSFLLTMVVLIFIGGIARLLRVPQNWTIDIATCLFAWACFLAADIAWRRDALMSIDLLTARLSPALRRGLATVNLCLIAGFLAYVIWAGIRLSWVSRARSFQGIPEISYALVTMSLPAGAALLLMTTGFKLYDLWSRDNRPGPGGKVA